MRKEERNPCSMTRSARTSPLPFSDSLCGFPDLVSSTLCSSTLRSRGTLSFLQHRRLYFYENILNTGRAYTFSCCSPTFKSLRASGNCHIVWLHRAADPCTDMQFDNSSKWSSSLTRNKCPCDGCHKGKEGASPNSFLLQRKDKLHTKRRCKRVRDSYTVALRTSGRDVEIWAG